jgi:hypothetical protein
LRWEEIHRGKVTRGKAEYPDWEYPETLALADELKWLAFMKKVLQHEMGHFTALDTAVAEGS